MKQLHIKLDENSPAIRWADAQADKVGARGHVGTHLDCYTKVPEKSEYNITASESHMRSMEPEEVE